MTCPCEQPLPPNLREVVKCVEPTLFHQVMRPASLGDDTATPATELNYRNVLLVYEANGHAYLYSSDGVPTFISYLPTNTEELEQAVQALTEQLEAEISQREQSDTNLQTQISSLSESTEEQLASLDSVINDFDEVQVQKDTAVSSDASTVTITKTLGKLRDDNLETAIPLPVASETEAGVMNAATYNAVQENSENIDSILGGAVVIDDLPADPTQDELTLQWKTATGKTELINRASIYDETNKKVWYYYENANAWKAIDATPSFSVSIATNDTPGIVKGSTEDGQVAVEADGSMSLNGYDGMQHDIENLSQLVAGIEVPKLPTSMVYDFVSPAGANNPSTADNANITARVVNTTTGNVTNATLMMPMASGTQAGSVTANDKAKLDSLLEIKSLNDSLELDENGQLSVVGGGGSDVNLLTAYTATVEDNDVYDAAYVNKIGRALTNNAILFPDATNYLTQYKIGGGTTGYFGSISIGTNAASAGGVGNIAIGYNASTGRASGSTYTHRVAIGSQAMTTRDFEFSIGNTTSSGVETTSYIAHVKAGELPTDAVNLQQMQDYVAEHAGGGSAQLTDAEVTKVQNLGLGSLTNMDGVLQSETDVQIEFARKNLTTGVAETQTATIEAATSEEAGVMLAADKVKLDSLPSYLIASDGQTAHTPPIKAETTVSELRLVPSIYNTSTNSWLPVTPPLWKTVLPLASDSNPGIMSTSDKVKLDTVPELTEMQWTRTGNLPPAVVTGFEDTTYGTDTITMHLDTKDLATGGVAVQELELDGAVANTAEAGGHAGLMTAFQATQLATLAEGGGGGGKLYDAYGNNTDGALTQAFVSGVLNSATVVIGSGATIPSTDTTSYSVVIGRNADTAKATGETNTCSVVIGTGAKSVAGTYSNTAIGAYATAGQASTGHATAIGKSSSARQNAVAIGDTALANGLNSIAIGQNSTAGSNSAIVVGFQAHCSYPNSVALGSYTTTTRQNEVSVGDLSSTGSTPATRFLANVTAGELLTDATNLKQVRDAVIGDVLYTSTEAEATITLSAAVSQYERLEIIGSWTMPFTETSTPLQVIAHWHLNDQDNSRTFQLRATDLDVANNQKTEVVETWTLTNSTTIELASAVQVSGELTTPEMEALDTPSIIITKVIGIKAI